MKKNSQLFFFSLAACFLAGAYFAQAQAIPTIQTNAATSVSSSSANLNGQFFQSSSQQASYTYFQWGTTTNYGNQTNQQYFTSSASFSQNISGLVPNTTYHFRSVAQGSYGTVIGQDIAFTTLGSNQPAGELTVNKKAINLTANNFNWSTSINAKPFDILVFAVTLQAGSQDVHNIVVQDILPNGLIFRGNLTVNAALNTTSNPATGINIGTISANGIAVVSYQAQVAAPINFAFGATTLTSTATVMGSNVASQTATEAVTVNRSLVDGAIDVPTGFTNNILTDYFFLPLLIIFSALWFYFSGEAYTWAKKLKAKLKK